VTFWALHKTNPQNNFEIIHKEKELEMAGEGK
jgi:hypothetical protein